MPEQFDDHWLTLREPADHAARPASLLQQLTAAMPEQAPWHIVDLGAGTGSNLRYLAPRLDGNQQWLLLDHDAELLNQAINKAPIANATKVETHVQDISAWPLPIKDAHLVTAAALLDLVTADWLAQLAQACAQHRLPALLALNYDGRINLSPEHPSDALIIAAVNAHQQSEKAMGLALGPKAVEVARQQFMAQGYQVLVMASDWQLTPAQPALQRALLEGWHEAACAQQPQQAALFDIWLQDRIAQLASSEIRVGHQDILAIP